MNAFETLAQRHSERGAAFVTIWGRDLVAEFSSHAEECAFVSESVGLLDQSYRGIVDLSGDATFELLERITSNHPAELRDGQGQLSALLTAKGRLVAGFQLFRESDDRFRLVLPDPVRDGLLAEINKYAFLSDVSVTVQDTVGVLALRGPRAIDVVKVIGGDSDSSPLARQSLEFDGLKVDLVRTADKPRDTLSGGFDLWVSANSIGDVWAHLGGVVGDAGGGLVGWEAAESSRVAAGFARWAFDYEDSSFPTEVCWGEALTYDKCYVGQEVVARMRTYGSDNRKLFRLFTDTPLQAGDSIIDASGAKVGRVTSSARPASADAPNGLGLLKRKAWDAMDLKAGDPGAALRVEPL